MNLKITDHVELTRNGTTAVLERDVVVSDAALHGYAPDLLRVGAAVVHEGPITAPGPKETHVEAVPQAGQ